MSLSRRVSRVRVTNVAMVSQPKPKTMGMTARPLSPISLKSLSMSIANRGRYPESSMSANARKNVVTMGRIIAIA
jgi:hypothetical protein